MEGTNKAAPKINSTSARVPAPLRPSTTENNSSVPVPENSKEPNYSAIALQKLFNRGGEVAQLSNIEAQIANKAWGQFGASQIS